MYRLKKAIIIVCLIILLLVVIIMINIIGKNANLQSTEENEESNNQNIEIEEIDEASLSLDGVIQVSEYLTIKKCIQTQLNTEENQIFYPIELISLINNGKVSVYKVKGIVQNSKYTDSKEIFYILNISYNNKSFAIKQLGENEYIKYTNNNSLLTEKYISFGDIDHTDSIISDYLETYKALTLANPKYTYDKMTEECKNKKFQSLEKYEQYVKDNYDKILSAKVEKYSVNENAQYVIKDQYNNSYIFDATIITEATFAIE